jgi:hypothetical protein
MKNKLLFIYRSKGKKKKYTNFQKDQLKRKSTYADSKRPNLLNILKIFYKENGSFNLSKHKHLNNKMLSLVFYRVTKAASIAEKKS